MNLHKIHFKILKSWWCVSVFELWCTCALVCVHEVPAQSCTSHTHQTLAGWACFHGICAECISSWRRARLWTRPSLECWFCCCPGRPDSLPSWRKQRRVLKNAAYPIACARLSNTHTFYFGLCLSWQRGGLGWIKWGVNQQVTPSLTLK